MQPFSQHTGLAAPLGRAHSFLIVILSPPRRAKDPLFPVRR
jgi:hypothetical protein